MINVRSFFFCCRKKSAPSPHKNCRSESGNILFVILLAVVLIGLLTAAIQSTNQGGNIDKESLLLRATEVQRYASEMERGVVFILNNGVSENDIRFAYPDANSDYGDLSADTDPSNQLFHRDGGGVTYRAPPDDINDGSKWEFYGQTALPEVGSDEAELIAVLPNVTQAFCEQINKSIGYDAGTQPEDTATCLNGGASARFDDGTQFASSPNTVDETTFSLKPAKQGCVKCTADGTYHYFDVLLAR